MSNIPCPDEKGTERSLCERRRESCHRVTFLAPMKRGLKDSGYMSDKIGDASNIPCPDEKGTESIVEFQGVDDENCNIPCPDEKGTERCSA